MAWLEQLDADELRHWLQHTSVPMMASLPDGKILWCNQACENMTGYTMYELIKMDWRALTDGMDDLAADIEAAKEVEAGVRKDYKIHKLYRTKNGPSKRVILHVMRNPIEGTFGSCFVSIYPIDWGYEFSLAILQEMQDQQLKIFALLSSPAPTWLQQYLDAYKKHPTPTVMATVGALTFIFGNRVLEIAAAVSKLFAGALNGAAGAPP